ncbi:MAG: tetratricopeptide repeat protein [Chitinophagaceae bacterium]|nr:tetratricopeptide repeat protein [Chitinophagaceae bacterium]
MKKYDLKYTPSACLSKNQLFDYLEYKLSKEEVYIIESHLNDCELCSDAIDGFYENKNSKIQLVDLKNIINSKIEALPEQQILKSTKKTNTNWAWAAALLLLISIGGFSLFKYIDSNKQQNSKNELAKNDKNIEVKTPNDENDIVISSDEIKEKINTENKKSEIIAKNDNVIVGPRLTQKVPAALANKIEESQETLADETPDNNNSQFEDISIKPEIQEKKDAKYVEKESVKAIPATESRGGMDYDKLNMNYARNEQSNISNAPKAQNQQLESVITSGKNKKIATVLNSFETAMSYFNSKKYRKSIPYFEKALEEKNNNIEDVKYYLAKAYLENSQNNNAFNLLNQLLNSAKYGVEAKQLLETINSIKKKKN